MPTTIRRCTDASLQQVKEVLDLYEARHPDAQIDAYRQNSASIRARIIDPAFKEFSRGERHEMIWRLLQQLPEGVQSQIGILLLLTPEEKEASFASFEFDNPTPSDL